MAGGRDQEMGLKGVYRGVCHSPGPSAQAQLIIYHPPGPPGLESQNPKEELRLVRPPSLLQQTVAG